MKTTLSRRSRRAEKGRAALALTRRLGVLNGQIAAARREIQAALRGGAATREPKIARALAASLVYLERGREILKGAR